MKATNKSKSKQDRELSKISPLIRSLGYIPNSSMCGDRPDICIPSYENKEIGIEVTDYAERFYLKAKNNEVVKGNLQLKAQNDFEKILESYIIKFDNREKDKNFYPKNSGYRIYIWLAGGLFPYQENLDDYEKIICREIDNFLFPSDTIIENKFIADVRIELIPNATKSIIDYQRGFLEIMTPVDENIISQIIKDKNVKLLKYKERKCNEPIKEYWLVICLPYRIQDVTKKYRVSSNIQTDYDKIFFVQDYRVWQVK